jgi:hypothetical protein
MAVKIFLHVVVRARPFSLYEFAKVDPTFFSSDARSLPLPRRQVGSQVRHRLLLHRSVHQYVPLSFFVASIADFLPFLPVLLILTASLYIVITLPSLRLIAAHVLLLYLSLEAVLTIPLFSDPFNKAARVLPGADFFSRMQAYFAARNSGTLGDRARENAAHLLNHKPMTWDERVQHVQVMCAANTIAMALLAGVVLLQVRLSRLFTLPQLD